MTEGREGGAADVCEEEGEALEGGAVGEGLVQQEARLLHLLEARRCTRRPAKVSPTRARLRGPSSWARLAECVQKCARSEVGSVPGG